MSLPQQHLSTEGDHVIEHQNEPYSPVRLSIVNNSQTIQSEFSTPTGLMSPKRANSSKLLSQQSPDVLKNKYNILQNLYDRAQKQRNQILGFDQVYNQKKQQHDYLKLQLQAKIKGNQSQQSTTKTLLSSKQSKIKQLQSQYSNLINHRHVDNQFSNKLSQLKKQITNLQNLIVHRINLSKQQSIKNQINLKIEQLQLALNHLSNNKNLKSTHNHQQIQSIEKQKRDYENVVRKFRELETKPHKAESERKNSPNQQRKLQITQLVEQKKHQINVLKSRIEDERKRKQENNSNQSQSVKIDSNQLTNLKAQIDKLRSIQSTFDKSSSKTQANKLENDYQNNQKLIQKQKNKISQLKNTTSKQQTQVKQLQHELQQKNQPKLKYVQKAPQQLFQLQKRKQQLTKLIKQQTQKYNKQLESNADKVPASVVQRYTKNVERLQEMYKKIQELILSSQKLNEQNKKLSQEKQRLDWGEKEELKKQQLIKQRQDTKHKALEQDVNNLRKQTNTVNIKLEEYQTTYPHFNVEKKLKKPEPVVQQNQVKEDKNAKKGGKNNKNEPQNTKQQKQKKSPQVSEQAIKVVEPVKPQKQQIKVHVNVKVEQKPTTTNNAQQQQQQQKAKKGKKDKR